MKAINNLIERIESIQNGNRSIELGLALILPKLLLMTVLEVTSRGSEVFLKRANNKAEGLKVALCFLLVVVVLACVNIVGAELVTLAVVMGLAVSLGNTYLLIKNGRVENAEESAPNVEHVEPKKTRVRASED